MLAILITSTSLDDSRARQDEIMNTLGEEGVAPILWVSYVATRTRTCVVIFSNRYIQQLVDAKDMDFVLCDDPIREALERTRR